LSGLLVKSTLEMKYVIQDLERQKLEYPVICGGAALTRKYVEDDLRREYSNAVFLRRRRLRRLARDGGPDFAQRQTQGPAGRRSNGEGICQSCGSRQRRRSFHRAQRGCKRRTEYSQAAVLGIRVKKDYDLAQLFPYINETALFKNQWQLKTASQEDYAKLVEEKYRPIRKELEAEIISSGLFEPKVVWGYYPAQSEGMT
jgi:5-methyltetrahydrofolate--homocysteine methyltransferase